MTRSGSNHRSTGSPHASQSQPAYDPTINRDLQPMIQQLTHDGFICTDQVMFAGHCFECVASQTRFDQTLGRFIESFVLFASVPNVTDDALRELDQCAARYLRSVKSIHKPIGSSCDTSATVVMIVPTFDAVDSPTSDFAPLLFDRSTKRLIALDGTPQSSLAA